MQIRWTGRRQEGPERKEAVGRLEFRPLPPTRESPPVTVGRGPRSTPGAPIRRLLRNRCVVASQKPTSSISCDKPMSACRADGACFAAKAFMRQSPTGAGSAARSARREIVGKTCCQTADPGSTRAATPTRECTSHGPAETGRVHSRNPKKSLRDLGDSPENARQRRERLMIAAVQLAPSVGIAIACLALGVSRAGYYRRQQTPRPPKVPKPRCPSPRALSSTERQGVLDVLNSPRFVDQAPAQVQSRTPRRRCLSLFHADHVPHSGRRG